MRRGWVALVAGSAALLLLLPTSPASAAATRTLALWDMNETESPTALVDSSGNGINGTIGSEVVHRGTVHTFGYLKPDTPPAHPGHLDVVNDSRLNPGTRDFAVELRLRWTRNFGNIIQKGQSGTRGGYFKLQAPSGVVQCLFRGSTGSGGAGSGRPLNDGQWHTIRCERTANAVTFSVDGVVTGRDVGPTGTISNTKPLTIAGKGTCDQVTVTCDYWVGDMDWVRVDVGP
jgi:hypothetical protein